MSDQENYVPKVGDHVRVTKEGVVDQVKPYESDYYTVSIDGLHYTTGPRYGHTLTKLADPEPGWDAILVDRENDVWQKPVKGTAYWNHRSLDRTWAELNEQFGPIRIFREAS